MSDVAALTRPSKSVSTSAPFAAASPRRLPSASSSCGSLGDGLRDARTARPRCRRRARRWRPRGRPVSSIAVDEVGRARPALRDDRRQERRPSSCEKLPPKTSATTRVRAAGGAAGSASAPLRCDDVADDPRRGEQLAGGVEVDAVGGVERRRRRREGLSGRAAHYFEPSRMPPSRTPRARRGSGRRRTAPRVFGERLADDAAGEVEGEGAHLAAQRDERRLALGLDLRLRVRR